MTEPDHSPHSDELLQRYREASAEDTRRPGAHVREAVRAHAQMVINAGKQPGVSQAGATANAVQRPAANQSRWKISALASVALVGLTGLLMLQFDRGNNEEKELAFGRPSPTAQPSPATSPSAATATAPTPSPPMTAIPGPVVRQTPAPEPDARKRSVETAKPALKSPAPSALDKSTASPSVNEAAAQKKEAKAPLGGVAAPPPAPSPLPAPAAAPAPPATVQDSTQPPPAPYTAGARIGSLTASPPPSQADTPAAAPAARPVPAAPSAPGAAAAPAPEARAAAAQQKQENALQFRAPRAETNAGPNRLAGALQDAARAGRLELLERLLQQGAPVNAADTAGRTPLVLAVMQGHTAVVQRLLAAGANPALVDQDGLNALQHARRLGFDGIARLIEAAS
ncbi:ankyrin repeat domain-containing protein [Polaromonas aquatica]|uniref:ankyrin repeat domain-containing protein n=1 Tax=Polaromonas aquatica TaxID=332657 RepID=UPI003D6540B4